MNIDANQDVRLEGDCSDPQAIFWTKATHVPTGVTVSDSVGVIRKRELIERLHRAVAHHYKAAERGQQ